MDSRKGAVATRKRIDERVEHDTAAAAKVLQPWLAELGKKIKSAKDRDALSAGIDAMVTRLGTDDAIARAFREANTVAQIAGRLDTALRLKLFAAEKNIMQMSADEAIEALKNSTIYDEKLFKALLQEIDARTEVGQKELVKILKEKLKAKTLEALDRGLTYDEFAIEILNPETNGLGIGQEKDSYLRMAFRTNVNTAYSSGKYDQVEEIADERPYWQYLTMADASVRPTHRKLDNAVFAFKNPATEMLIPPIDFNCRCVWVSLPEVPGDAKLHETAEPFREAINPEFGW